MSYHFPDLDRLSRELRDRYNEAAQGEKMTAVLLFGIVHGREMAALSTSTLQRLAHEAGLPTSFATELRKMVKLACYVTPAHEAAGDEVGVIPRSSSQPEGMADIFARLAKPLPPGYRFDREQANAR